MRRVSKAAVFAPLDHRRYGRLGVGVLEAVGEAAAEVAGEASLSAVRQVFSVLVYPPHPPSLPSVVPEGPVAAGQAANLPSRK